MKTDKYLTQITAIASLLTAITSILYFVYPEKIPQFVFIAVIIFLGLIILVTFIILSQKPSTLSISLLGSPGAGKSVYLTVLFSELITNKKHMKQISFQQYGVDTVEKISSNYSELLKGNWLPATSYNDVFYFRANAIIKTPVLPKKFKLEIGDYAGEHLSKINNSDSSWYHQSSFFKDVISSDILFLAIDSTILVNKEDYSRCVDVELSFVAALQILIQEKGLSPGQQSNTPVAILFTKADILNNNNSEQQSTNYAYEELINKLPRLNNLLKARFKNCKFFATSSVGHTIKGNPPKKLEPFNVVEPLIWSLRKK